jgi:pSer/pThr/pTyr-binding forkhead associated (FHA) protein
MLVGRLSLLSGPHVGRTAFVLKDVTVFEVGRAAGSHVKITDPKVAMNHCRLFRKDEEFTVYALSDSRPTLRNDEQVKKVVLQSGDRLRVGDTELLFELLTPEEAAKPLDPSVQPASRQKAKPAPTQAEPAPAEAEPTERVEAQAPTARLVVLDGKNRGTTYQLNSTDRVKIGRASSSDIRLSDVKVSRDHCIVEQMGGHFVVIDLESANGTIVNGERVRKTVLKNNDFLRLGFTVLKFQTTP